MAWAEDCGGGCGCGCGYVDLDKHYNEMYDYEMAQYEAARQLGLVEIEFRALKFAHVFQSLASGCQITIRHAPK